MMRDAAGSREGSVLAWLVVTWALIGLGAGPAAAQDRLEDIDVGSIDDVLIVLTITSDLSPYDSVRFELKTRGSTLIASLSKALVGGYDELADVGLIPGDELPGLIAELVACGVDDLPGDGEATGDVLHFELEVRIDDFERLASWPGRSAAPGTAQWCVSQLVAETYYAHSDPVPFRNRFWDEGEFGQLNVDSVPSARLFIDGHDTGLTTPVYGYRLAPGVHDLRFVNELAGIDRTYDVTIEIDLTTQLDVELR